jgi:hypothetical protein
MTERTRWIYAVPRDPDPKKAKAARPAAGDAANAGGAGGVASAASAGAMLINTILEAEGLRCEERDAGAGVARYSNEGRTIAFVVFDSADLEVVLVEASGGDAAPILAKVIDKTGFYAQTQLLRTALDVREPEAAKSLKTLAHMVVVWDEDWSDLFLLHLASPDPVVRHEAALSVSVAAMVARDAGPAVELLSEAIRRESFPKLRDTLKEALNLVQGMTGGPVEIKPEPTPEGDPRA